MNEKKEIKYIPFCLLEEVEIEGKKELGRITNFLDKGYEIEIGCPPKRISVPFAKVKKTKENYKKDVRTIVPLSKTKNLDLQFDKTRNVFVLYKRYKGIKGICSDSYHLAGLYTPEIFKELKKVIDIDVKIKDGDVLVRQ